MYILFRYMDPQGTIGPYKAARTHGFKAYGPKLHKHSKASALLSLWGASVSWGVVLLGFSLKGFAASVLVLSFVMQKQGIHIIRMSHLWGLGFTCGPRGLASLRNYIATI